jgi:hypothetical protein
MRACRLFILVSLLTSVTALAQSGPRDLQIRAKVLRTAAPEETKMSITFQNTSDHRVSFPKPILFCQKLPGSMTVVSKFKSSDPNSEQLKRGIGCAADKGIHASEPSIAEEAKDWLRLEPGQSVDVQDQLSHSIIIGDAGTYRLQVIYSAPSFDDRQRQDLGDAGIAVPSPGDYFSNTIIFEIEARQADAK